jgi:hypothetical protein
MNLVIHERLDDDFWLSPVTFVVALIYAEHEGG